MKRRTFPCLSVLALSLLWLSACTNPNDLDKAPVPLGNFSLGHNVVVAPTLVKSPVSREVDKEDFIAAMKEAIDERFRRYEGDRLYHIGISLEGYALAPPGIPLVASPKSILIFNVTIFDDAKGEKLNKKVKQITVIESFGSGSVLGSGYTQTAEEQMHGLARNGAKEIQNWLVRMNYEKGWFKDEAGDEAKAKDTTEAEDATGTKTPDKVEEAA